MVAITANGSGIADGGDYLHNSPSEAQKFNVVQLLISGTSAPTFGNTLLGAVLLINLKKMNTKELKLVLTKIEKSKEKIATERDKLRELYDELETLLDSFDRGLEAIENGKREIEDGIDALSELV